MACIPPLDDDIIVCMPKEKVPTNLYAYAGMEAKYRIAGMLYLHLWGPALTIEDDQGIAALWVSQVPEETGDTPLIANFGGANDYWYGNMPTEEAQHHKSDPEELALKAVNYAEFRTESASSAISLLAGAAILNAAEERYAAYKSSRARLSARMFITAPGS